MALGRKIMALEWNVSAAQYQTDYTVVDFSYLFSSIILDLTPNYRKFHIKYVKGTFIFIDLECPLKDFVESHGKGYKNL